MPARQRQLEHRLDGRESLVRTGDVDGDWDRDWTGLDGDGDDGDGDGGGLDPLAELRADPPCWAGP